nr:RNA-directed DNA polymerase, eukaryota, reverse transcriptase zinc-binding domain protein [Tanacetum cinerariifolium]
MVKGMRSYITSMYTYVPSPTTHWNIAIPLKIDINTWRVLNGRLATRSNLDRRGIDIDSVRCPLCDDDIETEEHLFIHCKVAKEIWLDVLKWWRIPNVSFVTLHDLIHLADHTLLKGKFSSVFDAIVYKMMSENGIRDHTLHKSEMMIASSSNGVFDKLCVKHSNENAEGKERKIVNLSVQEPVNCSVEAQVAEVEYIESDKLDDLEDVDKSLKVD